jgi:transposase
MQTPLDIGADISKDYVIVACAKQSLPICKLPNKRAALSAWLKRLPAGSRIGMEATGTYHELLATLALRLGLVVYVLNAKDVHHYAKGIGQRGKTDRVDAALIARYVAQEHRHLHAWQPASPAQRQLQRLVRRRAKLTSARAALRSTLEGVPSLRSELRALLQRFDALIAKLDTQARELVKASQEREQAFQLLDAIPAVGNAVGIGLLASLERWPLPRADAFVAFIGLDPRPDDSGKKSGRRRLSKRGDPELRRLLYIAAMSASRTRVWAPLYQRALARGLSRIEALVILARHIARTAWSVYTHKTNFDPQRLQNT